MEEKNFEPVTARSLARKLYGIAHTGFYRSPTSESDTVAIMESLIEPHIRKPSDGMMADVGWVTGGMKSVPARCEEAYNELREAVKLLMKNMSSNEILKVMGILNKPNPFKEADIIRDNENKKVPLAPFDLELAKNGAKVVTKDGLEVRIVADDLAGTFPILGVITKKDGSKYSGTFTEKGNYWESDSDKRDLFILEEPESVYIHLYRDKSRGSNGSIFAKSNNKMIESDNFDFIKTIKVWI